METLQKEILPDGSVKTLYKTQRVCSQYIEVGVKDGIVNHCHFYGGCDGNTKGLAQLVVGMKAEDVIKKLDGTTCGMRRSSCPDQLCRAIEQAMK